MPWLRGLPGDSAPRRPQPPARRPGRGHNQAEAGLTLATAPRQPRPLPATRARQRPRRPKRAAAKRRLAEHPGARLAGGLCSGATLLTSFRASRGHGALWRLRARPPRFKMRRCSVAAKPRRSSQRTRGYAAARGGFQIAKRGQRAERHKLQWRTGRSARPEAPAGCGAPSRSTPAIIIGRYAFGRNSHVWHHVKHNAQLCSPERIGGAPPAIRTRAPETNRCASAVCPRETRRSFIAFAHGALLQFPDTRRAPSNRETRLRKIAPVRRFLRPAYAGLIHHAQPARPCFAFARHYGATIPANSQTQERNRSLSKTCWSCRNGH